jgi:hypothetical protein
MTDLGAALGDYLRIRRALGYKLERAEKLLGQFVDYCDQVAVTRITTEVAVAWATMPTDASPGWWGQRLGVVRCFALWLQTRPGQGGAARRRDRSHPRPSGRPLPLYRRRHRLAYGRRQEAALPAAASHVPDPGRVAGRDRDAGREAIRLDRDDIDWELGLLRVNRWRRAALGMSARRHHRRQGDQSRSGPTRRWPFPAVCFPRRAARPPLGILLDGGEGLQPAIARHHGTSPSAAAEPVVATGPGRDDDGMRERASKPARPGIRGPPGAGHPLRVALRRLQSGPRAREERLLAGVALSHNPGTGPPRRRVLSSGAGDRPAHRVPVAKRFGRQAGIAALLGMPQSP